MNKITNQSQKLNKFFKRTLKGLLFSEIPGRPLIVFQLDKKKSRKSLIIKKTCVKHKQTK